VNLRPEIEPEFILALLRTEALQRYFSGEIRVVAQPTLNIKQIKEAPIIMPPSDSRKRFALLCRQLLETQARQQGSFIEVEALFQSLQHRAFTGQL
jgi:type I restriction enzyme S subunit